MAEQPGRAEVAQLDLALAGRYGGDMGEIQSHRLIWPCWRSTVRVRVDPSLSTNPDPDPDPDPNPNPNQVAELRDLLKAEMASWPAAAAREGHAHMDELTLLRFLQA